MESFTCILFLRQLHLDLNMCWFIRFMLSTFFDQESSVRLRSYTFILKRLAETDIKKMSRCQKLCQHVKIATHVRRHFLAPIGFTEILVCRKMYFLSAWGVLPWHVDIKQFNLNKSSKHLVPHRGVWLNSFEPPHDKTNKMAYVRSELRSAWAFAQSDQSLRCPHEEILDLKLLIEPTVKTLIRQGGCPGWSESLLGAQSLCLFCHEVAHFVNHLIAVQ